MRGIWGDADRLTATPSPDAAPFLSPALNTRGGKRSDPGSETPTEHFPASCSPAGTSRTSSTSGTGACHARAAELRAAPAEGKLCPEGPWFYAARLRDWSYEAEPPCPLPSARCPLPAARRSHRKFLCGRAENSAQPSARRAWGGLRQPPTAAALVSGVWGCFCLTPHNPLPPPGAPSSIQDPRVPSSPLRSGPGS